MNVNELKITDKYKTDADEVLQEAIGKGFRTVIVIGINGEGTQVRSSAFASRLEILGALEAAKQHVWGAS
jgi:hypothetical protein